MPRELVTLPSPTRGRDGAGGHPCQGIWHTAAGQAPKVAAIAVHYDVDFSEHYLAAYLAERGIGVLGWNTRFRGAGQHFRLESALTDIEVGVRWLRDEARADMIVLLGNSGGASLTAAYRALRPDTPTDLYVSLNAHPGRPDVLTNWMDPSVTDEQDPFATEESLDMFANGPPYDAEFQERYRAAQRARNDRISAWARDELAGGERVFCVHRTWADLRFLDLTIDTSDRNPGCYAGDPSRANRGPFGIGRVSTLRTWLDMWSLEDSSCRAEPHLARVTDPALVVQSTHDQGCFPSDARAIHGALASPDKSIELVPGDHYLLHPQDARDNVADLVAAWIHARA